MTDEMLLNQCIVFHQEKSSVGMCRFSIYSHYLEGFRHILLAGMPQNECCIWNKKHQVQIPAQILYISKIIDGPLLSISVLIGKMKIMVLFISWKTLVAANRNYGLIKQKTLKESLPRGVEIKGKVEEQLGTKPSWQYGHTTKMDNIQTPFSSTLAIKIKVSVRQHLLTKNRLYVQLLIYQDSAE